MLHRRWLPPPGFDVLVIGSGASGLAAAVSAERAGARVAVATKGSLQANNSSKAQGGIQAAFGEDDSPEQHAAGRLGARSHETADMRLVEVLTGDAPSAIHWLEELGVEFTREQRRLPPRPLRRRDARSACCRSATAPATRSRRACAMRGRPASGTSLRRTRRCASSTQTENGAGARACGEHDVDAGDGRARRRRPLLRARREERGELSTNHPERDRRGDASSRSGSAPRRATSTRCSTTRTAAPGRRTCRATRSPRRRAPTAPCC